MRVFVGGLFHETNVFSPIRTSLSDYAIAGAPQTHRESLFGYLDLIDAARAANWNVIEGFYASAQPSGATDADSWRALSDGLIDSLLNAGPVDAVLLFCHGAQVADGEDDCEGALLARIRHHVGPNLPIGMEIDLHANVSTAMLAHATHLLACWEYPHIDFGARAHRLVALVDQSLHDAPRPYTAHRRLPIFANLPTRSGPGADFVAKMAEIEARPGVVSVSAAHGFALSDTPDAASVLWVSGARSEAEQALAELEPAYIKATLACAAATPLLSIAETIDLARQSINPHGPVVIADRSDNAGGGAAGDSTFLLNALLENGVRNAAIGLLWDPAAVQSAFEIGAGNVGQIEIGGRHGALSGSPVRRRFEVLSLNEGGRQRAFGHGAPQPLGRSAALRCDGVTVVVNSLRQQVMSREPFEIHELQLENFEIIVVKSTNHFEEAFRPIAKAILYCDAPGASSEDLSTFRFSRLRRPSWPLDPIYSLGA